MKREEKIAAESKWQRAKESVHSSQSFLPLTSCPSGRRVVNGSEKTSLNPGLQPHSMRLKSVFDCNYSVRQLKQTAKESAVISNLSALSFAVDFLPVRQAGSQRIKEYIPGNEPQPHSMWLKPVFDCNYSVRQLKQTAKESAVISNLSALSFAVDFSQRISEDVVRTGLQPKKANIECRISINDCRIEEKENNEHRLTNSSMRLAVRNRLALNKRISTVFYIKKPSAIGTYFPAEGCISESRAVRACLMIRVFNN